MSAEATAADPEVAVRAVLDAVVGALDLDAEIHVRTEGEELTGSLVGDDLGLFIGHHGQTIDAVQHLAQRIVHRERPGELRIVIDAAGYRDRRAGALRRQADDAAVAALDAGAAVPLDAMTSSERKVVHEHLRERSDVQTWSEGREPHRRLVVAPERLPRPEGA